jgi:Fe-S-cluster containining protein
MDCIHCGVCCTKTEMLLSKKDIARLEQKGYSVDSIVRFSREGYARLRNRGGFCVFYNNQINRCKVYKDRPEGCRIYPVIHCETKGIVIDHICQAKKSVTEKEKAEKGLKVLRLLNRIDKEASSAKGSSQDRSLTP